MFIGVLITVIGLVFYFLMTPTAFSVSGAYATPSPVAQSSAAEAVLRVLKPDELKVVQTLRNSGGEMSQRDIARHTGFTRLKTHRVVVRLADRGLVRAEGAGRTNKIILGDSLKT